MNEQCFVRNLEIILTYNNVILSLTNGNLKLRHRPIYIYILILNILVRGEKEVRTDKITTNKITKIMNSEIQKMNKI